MICSSLAVVFQAHFWKKSAPPLAQGFRMPFRLVMFFETPRPTRPLRTLNPIGERMSDKRTGSERWLCVQDVCQLLRTDIENSDSQAEWCRRKGINRPHLNQILLGRRPPTGKILEVLKLKMVVLPSKTDILARLSEEVDRAGGQSEWARRARISQSATCKVITGERSPGNQFFRALKLKKSFAYAVRTIAAAANPTIDE